MLESLDSILDAKEHMVPVLHVVELYKISTGETAPPFGESGLAFTRSKRAREL